VAILTPTSGPAQAGAPSGKGAVPASVAMVLAFPATMFRPIADCIQRPLLCILSKWPSEILSLNACRQTVISPAKERHPPRLQVLERPWGSLALALLRLRCLLRLGFVGLAA
jgi:hypothetical protein